jgi:arginine N-succinyltransferase
MRRPHPSGEGAMRMLEREGFINEGYVDIFDGGPTMSAPTDQIRTVHAAQEQILGRVGDETGGRKMMLAAGRLSRFAACYGSVGLGDGKPGLGEASAALLGIAPGDAFLVIER